MRQYCGHKLPDGLERNQKLARTIVTPTTKDEHDELISGAEIVATGRATQEQWEHCEKTALALFAHGQQVAAVGASGQQRAVAALRCALAELFADTPSRLRHTPPSLLLYLPHLTPRCQSGARSHFG